LNNTQNKEKIVPKETVKKVKEPVKTVKETVKTVKEPVKTVKEPVKTVKEPVKTVKEPVKTVKEPVKKVKESVKKQNNKLKNDIDDIDEIEKNIQALERSIKIDEEKDSKKALIKLLVEAKKNKETDVKSDISEKENFSSLNKQNNVIELNIKKKNKNNNMSINDTLSDLKQNKVFEDKIIEIQSNKIVDSECFNDYMINFDNKIKFRDININTIQIPKNIKENIIEGKNNRLKIIINEQEHIIELEENYYNRNEIYYYINEAFENNNINIKCDLVEDNFVFKSQIRFNMINEADSILPYLGFNKNSYINRNEYKSTNILKLGDNIFYLVIENISREPLFLINNDDNEIKKLKELNENYEVDHLIIKFYRTRNEIIKNDLEYKFFFEKEHKIILNFT
jgi:hypothetical protein